MMKISKMNLMNNFHPKCQQQRTILNIRNTSLIRYSCCQIYLQIKNYPDKQGGDSSNFQLIQKAKEVLSYPEKKKIYDKFGKQRITQIIQYQESIIKKCEPYNLGHKIALKDVALGAYHKNSQIQIDLLKQVLQNYNRQSNQIKLSIQR
ncbi:unnamed protein product [Paramecium primaurelia]|uniref:J domain-containing protein n=1 Tax=Paramecium primaurelia TaxID=5886 RepID=A0A8S1NI97_PARPR|nr:unnamed protein product [Paramecium primaurelia]